jgi:iron complex transport system permease protein
MGILSRNRFIVNGLLLAGLLILIFFDLTLGSLEIDIVDVLNSLFAHDTSNQEEITVRIFRIPRVFTALMLGIALAVSGLLMQTLFQNPLAGPYVLGINSGASLFVAFTTLSGFTFFQYDVGMVGAALVGALITGFFILFCSVYVKSKVSLLLIGIMFGSFVGALVNVLQSYSNPEDLKLFMLWSFGSLQNVQFEELTFFAGTIFVGLILALFLVKPLNLLVLGDREAVLLGVKIQSVRFLIILSTAILTGVSTAYCGPVAFVGLIVPNVVKLVYKTQNHFSLLIGSLLFGGILVVLCDIIMQLLHPFIHLPLNALTALMGAPIVVWIILKRF